MTVEVTEEPLPCDLHGSFSRWCGHCLEVNGFSDPYDARLVSYLRAQILGSEAIRAGSTGDKG